MPIVTRAPSDFEQLMLEYINRARADPEGEFDVFIADAATGTGVQENITSALDFFGVDLDVFLAQISVLPSVAPLAWNSALALAADGHTQALIDADAQSHQLPGELPLDERIEAEGYVNWSYLNENVYSYMQDPLHGHAAFFIDWGYGPDGMQDPPGHRDTIMASYLTEVGISVMAAPDGPSVGPWVVTQDFGSTWGYQAQLVGVVIDDADGDRFYDMGEGMGGVTVTATSSSGQVYTTTSWDSGGYQMVLPEGSYTVRFSGGALSGVLSYQLEMGGENAKLDGVAQDGSSVPGVVLGTPDSEILTALDGYGQILIGNGGADVLVGAADDNTLIGDAVDAAGLPELGAQVYRLYLATLDRVPDPTGHDSWTERLLTGEKTLLQAAGGFVNSTEFQNTYGSLDNEAFVTLLYQNVLDRDPDATGLANWVARLEDGMSR
ncbi:DUF4214 domain-containing protein, partial [Salipiger sp. P9]|uniref:DUF4214 domain-containing protein n=1 Tax=Salipiger pentaromativorans TaxID=2943193 RepID=UPI0021579033